MLRHGVMASALVGASRVEQVEQCVDALNSLAFDAPELQRIYQVLG